MARRRKKDSEDGCLGLTFQLELAICSVIFYLAAVVTAIGILVVLGIIAGTICVISFLVRFCIQRWRDKHPDAPSFSEMIVILMNRMLGYMLGCIEEWKYRLKNRCKNDDVDTPLRIAEAQQIVGTDQSTKKSDTSFTNTTSEPENSSSVEHDPVHPIDWPPRKKAKKKYSKEFIDLYAESCNAYLELEEEKETYKAAFEENSDP